MLTHSHADHAGSAAKLKSDSGATLYCSSGDAPAARGDAETSLPPFLDRTPLQIFKPLLRLLLDRAGGILFVGDAAHHKRGAVSRG